MEQKKEKEQAGWRQAERQEDACVLKPLCMMSLRPLPFSGNSPVISVESQTAGRAVGHLSGLRVTCVLFAFSSTCPLPSLFHTGRATPRPSCPGRTTLQGCPTR